MSSNVSPLQQQSTGDGSAEMYASAANHNGIAPVDRAAESDQLVSNLTQIQLIARELLIDADHYPAEFQRKIEDVAAAAANGELVFESISQAVQIGTLDTEQSRLLSSELPHRILKAHTLCSLLLDDDEERFSGLREPMEAIIKLHDDCRRFITRLTASSVVTEKSLDFYDSDVDVLVKPHHQPRADLDLPAPLKIAPNALGERQARLLVVDDDDLSRNQLRKALEQLGHDVETACDGSEALALLENSANDEVFDLVLLDLCMKNVDGVAVLRELRLDYTLRSVPVIVVSASQDVSQTIHCIELGADDFLTKPLDEALLRARVASCLDKGAVRRRDRKLNEELRRAKSRLDDLLYEVFPYIVAQELRTGGKVQPRGCENVAIGFCDLVGFTSYCSQKAADEVVEQLQVLFEGFEQIALEHRVEKIKTIGDCFMMTAGVLGRFDAPVQSMLETAAKMRDFAATVGQGWDVRIGIHVGPLVAGMVGLRQFAFDVWGDSVNTAARVQNAAEPGMIALSEPGWAQVHKACKGKSIGLKPLKGTQAMEVFRFDGFRDAAER